MKPHPRTRKTIKWGKYGGAAVTVLLVVAWIASGWGGFRWGVGAWTLSLGAGRFFLDRTGAPVKGPNPLAPRWNTSVKGWSAIPTDSFWQFGTVSDVKQCQWTWHFHFDYFEQYDNQWSISFPLICLAFASLPPTVLAWRLDSLARRRERAHLCPKCGYDRTGILKDAKCPECGKTV